MYRIVVEEELELRLSGEKVDTSVIACRVISRCFALCSFQSTFSPNPFATTIECRNLGKTDQQFPADRHYVIPDYLRRATRQLLREFTPCLNECQQR